MSASEATSRRGALAGVLAAVGVLAGCGAPGQAPPRPITLLVTGFMHGQISDYELGLGVRSNRFRSYGGGLRTSSFLRVAARQRRQLGHDVLRLDLGDYTSGSRTTGSPLAMVTRGGASAALMATRGYDAILVGNREFHFGADRLAELGRRPLGEDTSRPLPLVSSNLREGGAAPAFAWPSLEVDAGGLVGHVRVVGLSPQDLAIRAEESQLGRIVVVPDPRDALRAVAPGGDRDLTILLTQIDIVSEREVLAEMVRGTGVDLVLGYGYGKGAAAYQQEGVWYAGLRNDLPGSAVLALTLNPDPQSGRVVSLREDYYVLRGATRKGAARNRTAHGGDDPAEPPPEDPVGAAALRRFADQIETLDRPLATLAVDVDGQYEVESTLGNLVADALRLAVGDADVGLVSSSVVDDVHLRAGPLLERDLYRAYRYPNDVVTVHLTGAELEAGLRDAIDQGLHFQVSGISYSYRAHRAAGEPGELVHGSLKVGGRALQSGRDYRVAMDSFTHRRNPAFRTHRGRPHLPCRFALRQHLLRLGEVSPKLEGRITRLEPGGGVERR